MSTNAVESRITAPPALPADVPQVAEQSRETRLWLLRCLGLALALGAVVLFFAWLGAATCDGDAAVSYFARLFAVLTLTIPLAILAGQVWGWHCHAARMWEQARQSAAAPLVVIVLLAWPLLVLFGLRAEAAWGSRQTPPAAKAGLQAQPAGLKPGEIRCKDCGRVYSDGICPGCWAGPRDRFKLQESKKST